MCDPILDILLRMRSHYSQSSRENAHPHQPVIRKSLEVPLHGTTGCFKKSFALLSDEVAPRYSLIIRRSLYFDSIFTCGRSFTSSLTFLGNLKLLSYKIKKEQGLFSRINAFSLLRTRNFYVAEYNYLPRTRPCSSDRVKQFTLLFLRDSCYTEEQS